MGVCDNNTFLSMEYVMICQHTGCRLRPVVRSCLTTHPQQRLPLLQSSGPFLHLEVPIPAPNLGDGIPLPIFQFWCESIPLQIFLKLHLVRGFHPKLVRGARSKMRGSNAEIVWRRARAARRHSTAPLKGVHFGCHVEPDASQKRPCTPILV